MLFDLNEACSRARDSRYDVCVCGTGPAGITVARKLAARGKKVLLLEGGGLDYSDQSQDLYKGRNVGRAYYYLDAGRLRYFGGTSNHWSGRCGILDPIDFEPREYFGMPGWPISRDEVLKGLDEAKDILDISGKNLAPSKDQMFPSALFARSGFALSPPTRFAEKYRDEIEQSPDIELFDNANLVDLRLEDNLARVKTLRVRNYKNQTVEVTANVFVIALGSIENARILLNADRQVPGGVGNKTDMVGRCFMEHLNVSIGRFLVTNPEFWKRGDFPAVATETMIELNNIGSGILDFTPNASPQSYGRLRVLKQFLRETGCKLPLIAELTREIVDFDCPGDGLITSLIEQAPNLDSRVSLTSDVDMLGLRRVVLNWQLSDRDKKTIRTFAVEAAKEMARLDCARVQLAPSILNTSLDIEVGGHAHQMGTTRMSADPRYGVVNENCMVHGIANLYIQGSSVFSSGGGTNPTLTVVLLALRLAKFLNGRSL